MQLLLGGIERIIYRKTCKYGAGYSDWSCRLVGGTTPTSSFSPD